MDPAQKNFASLRIGVLQFPGSNCDIDCMDAFSRHFGIRSTPVWHQDSNLPKVDALIIPGGFSFGDYLRSGALAAHSSIMTEVKNFASTGGFIMGICNGFQILVESGILPGVLLHNQSQTFICKFVNLKNQLGNVMRIPIAHGEGRYWISETGLADLESAGQVAYQYCDGDGQISQTHNPNGSVANIAGIYSKNKKVLGFMPHPERATDLLMGGSCDGLSVFKEFFDHI